MNFFYFDASALAKAYIDEKGTAIVERILENTSEKQWRVLALGVLETISIFVRKMNRGAISPAFFQSTLQTFTEEILENLRVFKVEATNILCVAAAPLIQKHSINSTDAVVLRSALDLADHERKQNNELILVTADQRLVTAAKAEGLQVINPETATLAEIEKLLHPVPPPAPSAT
ncbi:type II toxin-antitoxin system VapC family toxin [candidate division KSB1 bacterium]|nr:type II toxin-antitoxin system VapC family toxin [candidate division KSB1 bacterium]